MLYRVYLFSALFGPLIAFYSCQTDNPKTTPLPASLSVFLDNVFTDYLQYHPQLAATIGKKINYDKFDDKTAESLYKDIARLRNALNYIYKNFPNTDSPSEKLNIAYIKSALSQLEADSIWRLYSYRITQLEGDHIDIPNFLVNIHTIENKDDAIAYIRRLEKIETLFNEDIQFLTEQASKGIFPPKFTFKPVIEDISGFIKNLEKRYNNDILYATFVTKLNKLKLPKNIADSFCNSVFDILRTRVKKAYENLLAAVKATEKQAKGNNGVWALPNGNNYYIYALNTSITENFHPDTIFNTGLREIDRLQKEITALIPKTDFKGNYDGFVHYLQTNKRFAYTNDEKGRNTLLTKAQNYLDSIYPYLPKYFNILPKARCTVLPVEPFREKTAGAFYESPSEDGNRPGRYYVNLSNMSSEKTYLLRAIAYHETLPGHHMQIAIAQESTDIPMFRKYLYQNAFVEGWALYAELLSSEMGLYKNHIYDDIGRLGTELFRAARLVLDVGIHYKKWTKQQATEYMIANTLNAPLDCKREVERYFLWPGQATGYKMGMIKILTLREKAKNALKNKFKLSEFHDIILKNGSLPLPLLEQNIDNWITEQQNT